MSTVRPVEYGFEIQGPYVCMQDWFVELGDDLIVEIPRHLKQEYGPGKGDCITSPQYVEVESTEVDSWVGQFTAEDGLKLT